MKNVHVENHVVIGLSIQIFRFNSMENLACYYTLLAILEGLYRPGWNKYIRLQNGFLELALKINYVIYSP